MTREKDINFLKLLYFGKISSVINLLVWQSAALRICSGYKPYDLKECVLAIHNLQLNREACASQAIRDKYSQHKVI